MALQRKRRNPVSRVWRQMLEMSRLCPVLALVRGDGPERYRDSDLEGRTKQPDPRAERDVEFLRMQCNAEKHALGMGLVGGSLFFLGAQRAIWVLSNGSFANFHLFCQI